MSSWKPSVCVSVVACSSLLVSSCGLGEILSPAGPSGLDTDGDGIVDSQDPNPTKADPKNGVGVKGGGSNDAKGTQHELTFACDPSARSAKDLQRLSRAEYVNTLRDLITGATSAEVANAVMKAIDPSLQAFPHDAISKGAPFASMDQSVSQAHVDALMTIGPAVAAQLTSSSDRIKQLLGSCASDGDATNCVRQFIANFGKRALRHELNDAEKAFYEEVYDASGGLDTEGLADVIAVMLNAPDFVYRVEYGAKPIKGSSALFDLNDYEIATRLSYQFWQTMPDQELLDAAEVGEFVNEQGYAAQLDRVLKDPRAGNGLEQFVREWLALDGLRPLDSLNGTPVFDAFTGKDKPSATLKEEMIQDVTDSLAYHAQIENGTLQEWLESQYSFARSQALAAIYKVPVWDGKDQPPRMPAGERAGLITRAALLATGSANTRPIMKGILIRERLLCDELGTPPANAANQLPDLSGEKTTRELVEAVTQQPGSACSACHTTQINPLGFATEDFDALGRKRSKQDLYSDQGKVVASKNIDTTSVPRVWSQDTAPSRGASDLTSMLVDSGKVEACFAREYVRYTHARDEREDSDGCELEALRKKLTDNGGIIDALRAFGMLPQFRQRLVPSG
ncbi:MAG TPA: DUF1592 domain-containing protein [Polyangiales bacterium]